jgi:hypothetical protein
MPDKRKADYEKLYEIAARKIDKKRSDRRKEYQADRAAGRTPKLYEDGSTTQSEYEKSAIDYDNKNKYYAAPGEGLAYEVLKKNTQREKSSRIVRKGTGARKK